MKNRATWATWVFSLPGIVTEVIALSTYCCSSLFTRDRPLTDNAMRLILAAMILYGASYLTSAIALLSLIVVLISNRDVPTRVLSALAFTLGSVGLSFYLLYSLPKEQH